MTTVSVWPPCYWRTGGGQGLHHHFLHNSVTIALSDVHSVIRRVTCTFLEFLFIIVPNVIWSAAFWQWLMQTSQPNHLKLTARHSGTSWSLISSFKPPFSEPSSFFLASCRLWLVYTVDIWWIATLRVKILPWSFIWPNVTHQHNRA